MVIGRKLGMDGGRDAAWRYPELVGFFIAFVVSAFLWVLFFVGLFSLLHP